MALTAGVVAGPLMAEEVVLSEGGLTVRAPESLNCAKLPVIAMEGDLGAAFAGNRAVAGRLLQTLAKGLEEACPETTRLRFEGEDRGVKVSVQLTAANGWAVPGAVAEPVAAAAPAAAPAEPTGTTTAPAEVLAALDAVAPAAAATPPAAVAAAPAPEPEPPVAPPPLTPGGAFRDLAQFYGLMPMIRGYARLEQHETWTRIMAARAYAERPGILADDATAIELAQLMLTPPEFQQFVGPLAPTLQRYGGSVQGLSVFERRDLAERVRTQLGAYLDQRRQTGPIDIVHVVPLQLGEYSFDTGSFPLQVYANRNYAAPAWRDFALAGALDAVVFPTSLQTTVEEARQIDAFLRSRGNQQLFLGIFMTADPRLSPSVTLSERGYSPVPTPATLQQIALFADQELTQMVFDYTPLLAERHVAVQKVQAELARPLLSGEQLVRAIDTLNGGDAALRTVIAAMEADPNYQSIEDRAAQIAALRTAVGSHPASTRVRFRADVYQGAYSAMLGGLSVENPNITYTGFTTANLNFRMQPTFYPALSVIPLSPEQGAALSQTPQNGYQILIDADLVSGSIATEYGSQVAVTATFQPRRVILLSGSRGNVAAEMELLADVALEDAPALPIVPIAPITVAD